MLNMLMPIHRDGHKFIGVGAAITVLLFFIWPALAAISLAITLWLAFFFRDPDRVTPLRKGLVVAPADGKVIGLSNVRPPQEFGFGEALRPRLTIHLSLFDVHVNRSPISGLIVRSMHVPGAFTNPKLDKASEDNERRAIIIEDEAGREFAVVQIAGVVCRRIVSFAGEGDSLATGQRFGLIRFGSRVDLYLPPDQPVLVSVGQTMIAGETVIAQLEAIDRRPDRPAPTPGDIGQID